MLIVAPSLPHTPVYRLNLASSGSRWLGCRRPHCFSSCSDCNSSLYKSLRLQLRPSGGLIKHCCVTARTQKLSTHFKLIPGSLSQLLLHGADERTMISRRDEGVHQTRFLYLTHCQSVWHSSSGQDMDMNIKLSRLYTAVAPTFCECFSSSAAATIN